MTFNADLFHECAIAFCLDCHLPIFRLQSDFGAYNIDIFFSPNHHLCKFCHLYIYIYNLFLIFKCLNHDIKSF